MLEEFDAKMERVEKQRLEQLKENRAVTSSLVEGGVGEEGEEPNSEEEGEEEGEDNEMTANQDKDLSQVVFFSQKFKVCKV